MNTTYQDLEPLHPALVPYIGSYRLIHGNKPIHAKEILPRPGATMMLDFQGLRFEGRGDLVRPLIGFTTKPIQCATISEDRTCFVIKFTSYGLSQFISTPQDKLTDQVIDAIEVFGEGLRELHESLLPADAPSRFLELTESFLLSRIQEPDAIDQAIFQLADRLRKPDGTPDLSLEKKMVPISGRQLERRFRTLIGVNMTTYVRICRFDHAQALLYNQQSLPMTDVGYEAGYFDSAHFSREFKNLAQSRPKDYSPCTPIYPPETT